MFSSHQYELLDFGRGRKLERFGPIVLDRPCSAAARRPRTSPDRWSLAAGRYERPAGQAGRWTPIGEPLPSSWTLGHGKIRFELRPTPFGHVGVFPEQASNWDWLDSRLRSAGRPLKLLNLFAYTGGSTLAAAVAGAEVTHVDAAKNVVTWARRNAELSALDHAPVRWICEDAGVFVSRELRRGRRYDGLILDPPSYGHGPQSTSWKIERDLEPLLRSCGKLMGPQPRLILLTIHSPQWSPAALRQLLARSCPAARGGAIEARPLVLSAADGRPLPSGLVARWSSEDR